MRTKKPNNIKNSRENFDAYAKSSGGFGFQKFDNVTINLKDAVGGVGCCVSLSKTNHVFIMSTDSDNLEEALKELGIKKHERSAEDVSLVALYPAELQDAIKEREENDKKIFWVIHCGRMEAEMIYGMSLKYHPDKKVLGEAERCTKIECKLLLREAKWKRDNIDDVDIDDTHPDDKIPF